MLPIPISRDHLLISGTDISLSVFFASLRKGITIYGGMPNASFAEEVLHRECYIIDYTKDEVFQLRNALPTAEGALAIAMSELRRTLRGSRTLVVGYGRIGKLLGDILRNMGASVTVAARKSTDRALAQLHGCQTIPIHEAPSESALILPQAYHVIFNTVPVKLIDERILQEISEETLLIDLASAPGGIDYDAANRLGRKTVIALSLPGKVAPITAGEILGDLISADLEKRRGAS